MEEKYVIIKKTPIYDPHPNARPRGGGSKSLYLNERGLSTAALAVVALAIIIAGAICYTVFPQNDNDNKDTDDDTTTITLSTNQGMSTVESVSGKTISEPEVVVPSGYAFEGWYSDQSYTIRFDFNKPIYTDIVLYGKVVQDNNTEVEKHTITFVTDGTSVQPQSVEFGKVAAEPVSVKSGMVFDGWYTDQSHQVKFSFQNKIYGDLTLYAKFTPEISAPSMVTATFITEGSYVSSQTVEQGSLITEPQTSRTGYTFDGWYTDPEYKFLYKFSGRLYEDVTLYAKFTSNNSVQVFTVEFYTDGKLYLTKVVEKGDTIGSIDEPTKEGYSFIGWFTTSSSGIEFHPGINKVSGHLKLYAHFERSVADAIISMDKYVISPADAEDGYDLKYSYKDDENNSYYYLYLGRVSNVSMAYSSYENTGIASMELTYAASSTTEGNISYMSQICVSETTESFFSANASYHLNISAGFKAGGITAGVEEGWKSGVGYSLSKLSSSSRTDSYTTFSSWAKSESEAYSYKIEKEYPLGVYRLGAFSTCDLYAIVVLDNNGDYYYEYATSAVPDTQRVALDFSRDGDFSKRNDTQKFKLTHAMLASLPTAQAESEILTYDYSSGDKTDIGIIRIPAEVPEVLFVGSVSKTLTMNIVISPRNMDLKITMNNIKFTAPAGVAAINDEGSSATHHTITLMVIGNNVIAGGNGKNGYAGGYDGAGGSGDAGAIGINADKHSIAVSGSGNLSIVGGNGGSGGAGGNTDSSNLNTRLGGKGGAGGYGISCKSISFENATGSIIIKGGSGGNGGNGGKATAGYLAAGKYCDGGNGGQGGNGEHALKSDSAPVQPKIKPISLIGGDGGNGGAYGQSYGGMWGGKNGAQGANGNMAKDNYWDKGNVETVM
ncbi:MAG: InlB B-repeat-containing protein [Candidatus Methanoplasma sp.]|jgi:uncharacterized repeat protein (TIGR02543 family)|nr:InlB B-repeat-containing protein [Candidatus Methanoplasma sp.]